jgi:predicted protein tyrosine phosphatase
MPPGRPIRVLFICHYNRKRSATAERIFSKEPDLDARSAGTSEDALVRVNDRMLSWADLVFVMDPQQMAAVASLFPDHPAASRLICLDIEDDFHFLDPVLIALLRERTRPHLERARATPRTDA